MAAISYRQLIRKSDIGLLTIVTVLIFLSLASLFSFGLSGDSAKQTLLIRQAIFAVVGLVIAVILAKMDYRFWSGIHWVLYGLANFLLVAVLIFGSTRHGTTGWFAFGPVEFQPVELVKVIMAVVLARIVAEGLRQLNRWRMIIFSGSVVALPTALVMIQPDFGSAAVLVMMWIVIILVLPINRKYILAVLGLGIVVGLVGWVAVLQPYQKDRIRSFISPSRDALGAGYNVRQAIAAIGSGKLLGRGLGLGPQSQLNFLPERQTDFIFSSIGEELGFVGGGSVIVLFGLFFWRVVRLIRRAEDSFSSLVIVALGSIIFIQVVVNIGMNIGLVPVTGIPLPFLSYGGSALVAGLMIVGLLESIKVRQGTR